jgi:anti-sigma factor RsiW
MSEKRLDQALEAMRNEAAGEADLAAAKARVWEKLSGGETGACGGFRTQLKDYADGRLDESRRLLMEDHLGRCADCRRAYADMKGERKVAVMPAARRPAVKPWQRWAIAAGVMAGMLYLGRDPIDRLLAPSGPRATVEMASGQLYRLPADSLQRGAAIGEGEVVRTGPGARAVLRLADGSAVEVNERSELFVNAAWSGQTVHLQRGDVIVRAAKQRRGHLRVETHDSIASVKGTIFAVSTGLSGSLVTVVEGRVEVTQPSGSTLLTRGQQSASSPAVSVGPAGDAVGWSQDAQQYLALLGDFATIEKKLAALPSPALRTDPKLLQYLPPNPMVYGAIPNLNGTLQQVLALADQQAGESAAFQQWWSSGSGTGLKAVLNKLQAVFPMVGDEIVFTVAAKGTTANAERVPVILANVRPNEAEGLKSALAGLMGLRYQLVDNLLVASDSAEHVQWAVSVLGQGTSGEFAKELASRYQQGVGWLIAVDVADLPVAPSGGPAHKLMGSSMKYLFFEQRTVSGVEENRATLAFDGARTGIASWIASKGVGGAAQYVSSSAVLAFSASTLTSQQMYQEMVARISQVNPGFPEKLQEVQTKLGINIGDDVAAALGTDFAFAVETPTLPMPGWVLTAETYKPDSLNGAISKLVAAFNAQLAPADQAKRLVLSQENVNGTTWHTLKSSAVAGQQVAWTYDNGYIVMSNDVGVGMRAIQTRASGFPLVRSQAFLAQLPTTGGVSPAGFAWLNTKGSLGALLAKVPNPALQKLAADRDPVLVILNAGAEQLQLSSRTRLTSLVLDLFTAGSVAGKQSTKPAVVGKHA